MLGLQMLIESLVEGLGIPKEEFQQHIALGVALVKSIDERLTAIAERLDRIESRQIAALDAEPEAWPPQTTMTLDELRAREDEVARRTQQTNGAAEAG